MKMVEKMKNRKSFIGIVSIILPPLALFLGLPVLIKFSEKIYFDDFFFNFSLKLLYWGWIVGLIAGVRRKQKFKQPLKFQIRVTQEEKDFINYAREHHLSYSAMMK